MDTRKDPAALREALSIFTGMEVGYIVASLRLKACKDREAAAAAEANGMRDAARQLAEYAAEQETLADQIEKAA